MRILIPIMLSLSFGCSKDLSDADPCARAIENAERLVKENATARSRYGIRPLRPDSCKQLSAGEVSCISYASSWSELENCSRVRLGSR
jgi:hypothetical protein